MPFLPNRIFSTSKSVALSHSETLSGVFFSWSKFKSPAIWDGFIAFSGYNSLNENCQIIHHKHKHLHVEKLPNSFQTKKNDKDLTMNSTLKAAKGELFQPFQLFWLGKFTPSALQNRFPGWEGVGLETPRISRYAMVINTPPVVPLLANYDDFLITQGKNEIEWNHHIFTIYQYLGN